MKLKIEKKKRILLTYGYYDSLIDPRFILVTEILTDESKTSYLKNENKTRNRNIQNLEYKKYVFVPTTDANFGSMFVRCSFENETENIRKIKCKEKYISHGIRDYEDNRQYNNIEFDKIYNILNYIEPRISMKRSEENSKKMKA